MTRHSLIVIAKNQDIQLSVQHSAYRQYSKTTADPALQYFRHHFWRKFNLISKWSRNIWSPKTWIINWKKKRHGNEFDFTFCWGQSCGPLLNPLMGRYHKRCTLIGFILSQVTSATRAVSSRVTGSPLVVSGSPCKSSPSQSREGTVSSKPAYNSQMDRYYWLSIIYPVLFSLLSLQLPVVPHRVGCGEAGDSNRWNTLLDRGLERRSDPEANTECTHTRSLHSVTGLERLLNERTPRKPLSPSLHLLAAGGSQDEVILQERIQAQQR